eukprot:CAMPEP_0181181980 /NCGR_PEP_ID=MMETSP1096-20121128/7635_1 /TAXON_ID=156174 ORGANISM="Chrysochromulina ericina, Strain CCMP281" /NCGR_SAMPLE_ID=MMETSP1096 /ASSEMBLY_ACC=CAM_ASM_000453 /LENGTH=102 /DNA_ID=CAMNT_0023270537 /DNA_START=358 /DNA_END=663 /DNA_ORIENTATION=+
MSPIQPERELHVHDHNHTLGLQPSRCTPPSSCLISQSSGKSNSVDMQLAISSEGKRINSSSASAPNTRKAVKSSSTFIVAFEKLPSGTVASVRQSELGEAGG